MEKKYKQLTLVERCQIDAFSKHNHSARYRAKELKRANKTISMELARCTPYRAERVHENALKRRCFAEKRIKHDDKMKEMIHELLSIHLTPEQISGRMKLEKHAFPICTNTIYRLIKANKWQNILPRKGKFIAFEHLLLRELSTSPIALILMRDLLLLMKNKRLATGRWILSLCKMGI